MIGASRIAMTCAHILWCVVLGPDFWGLVNPEWYVCTKGKRQSPINIDPQKLLYDTNLRALRIDKHRVRVFQSWVTSDALSCHSRWNIMRPQTILRAIFCSVLCCRRHLPPALHLCPAVHISFSRSLPSRCSSVVVLFLCGHACPLECSLGNVVITLCTVWHPLECLLGNVVITPS